VHQTIALGKGREIYVDRINFGTSAESSKPFKSGVIKRGKRLIGYGPLEKGRVSCSYAQHTYGLPFFELKCDSYYHSIA
jgi:hypothetical protein